MFRTVSERASYNPVKVGFIYSFGMFYVHPKLKKFLKSIILYCVNLTTAETPAIQWKKYVHILALASGQNEL